MKISYNIDLLEGGLSVIFLSTDKRKVLNLRKKVANAIRQALDKPKSKELKSQINEVMSIEKTQEIYIDNHVELSTDVLEVRDIEYITLYIP